MISPDGQASPCAPVRIRALDGARLVACAHGGQVLGWSPAGDDRERLWLSPLAQCGPGQAIRGGIPVIFPQFAGRGPLPKHGFARDRAWELDTGSDGAPVARVACHLQDDERTRQIWPHPFTLILVAEASGPSLTITLNARNRSRDPDGEFTFTAALHTYLSADTATARVHGVGGRTAEDNAAGGTPRVLADGPLTVSEPLDVAVRDVSTALRLEDPAGDVEISWDSGFDSAVIWNPGAASHLPDVPPGGTQQFLCVEPARLTPVTLEPQGIWRARVTFTALVPTG